MQPNDKEITSIAPTTSPDVLICATGRNGFAKLTFQPDSNDVTLEELGVNPLSTEVGTGGPHGPLE